MGFLSRLTAGNDPAVKAWRDSEERWARILEIGPKIGARRKMRIELHFSDLPPTEYEGWFVVPRRVTPEVGQHVFYRNRSDGSGKVHYTIEWNEAPRYAPPPEVQQQIVADVIGPLPTPPPTVTAQQAMDPTFQLGMLIARRDSGAISEAQFERDKSDILRFAQDPAAENDPAVQRARLEQRHAAGEVTDAEYAERSRDLDNWVANLKRLG
jgi:hypothetical protein